MEEITREQFWELENKLGEIEKTTGKLEVSYGKAGSKLYKRGFKKWMRSMPNENIYLADASLIRAFLK